MDEEPAAPRLPHVTVDEPPGDLGDDHALSARSHAYASRVVLGDDWPIGPDHVDLAAITWETSRRARRRHATTIHRGDGRCAVRVAEKTLRKVGFDPLRETIRHELVHVCQFQAGVEGGHGDSFRRWIDPLGLQGTSSNHYDPVPADYRYRLYCRDCGAFVAGRYRLCETVRAARDDRLLCGDCGGSLRVETDGRQSSDDSVAAADE
jgi:predicted SprT family Zn-dependent metalloprotease